MDTRLKQIIAELIKLNNITSTRDERIEGIADLHSFMYADEAEYIEYQMEIASMVRMSEF